MPITKKRLTAYACLSSLLVFGAIIPTKAQGQQLPSQDVVVLIDCSASVSPYLSAITGIISRFVSGARYGDSFTCYRFSNNPVLVAGGKIEKAEDVAKLRSQLRQLRTGGEHTNYSTAIQRAMADIKESHRSRPAGDRVLLLITDGRQHSEDTKSEKKAFSELLKRYSDLQTGRDYSFYCFYIGNWFEKDLQAYLLTVGAHPVSWPKEVDRLDRITIADIRIMDQVTFLGNIPDTPTQGTFSLSFYPRRLPEPLAMIGLDLKEGFARETLDKFFNVSPRRFVCRDEAWNESFFLETRGFAMGSYAGTFLFRPSEPRSMLLFPRAVDFSFSISGSLQIQLPAPLSFGPTGFRGKYSETKHLSIIPSRADFPDSPDAIALVPEIDLPEGVRLNISKKLRENQITIEVSVSRHQKLKKNAGGEYKGRIKLVPQADWVLADSEIPISVTVAGRGIDFEAVALYLAVGAGCILAVVLLLLSFTDIRTVILDHLAHKTRPIGKLIITADPTKGIAKAINLDRLSEKRETKELLVGAEEGAHVELPHRSMMDKTYKFSGLKTKDEVHTIIEAGEGANEIIVNGMSRTGQVQLMHLDTIKLGAFEFRYEVPRPLRQAVLYFLNGDVWQGWILTWNTEAEGFHFLSRDRLPERKELYVRFHELKTVAIVRDFDGELTRRLLSLKVPRSGHRMRISLADQEELTGYALNWKEPGERFYFFPDTMGENVIFFFIERDTVRNMALLEEDGRGAERARKVVARVLEQMKKEIGGAGYGGGAS